MFAATHLIGFGAAARRFKPLGVDFTRATPDYYERATDFTGSADSALASGCFWARMDGNDGVSMAIFDPTDSGDNKFHLKRDASNKFGITAINTDASGTFGMVGSTNMSNANFGVVWFQVMWAIDWSSLPNAAKTLIRFNAAADTVTDNTNATDGTMDLTNTAWRMANTSGTVPGGAFDGCLAEFMYWPGVFIDWAQQANRDKVYFNGKPVDPGSDGSLVTGTAPLVYLSVRPGGTAEDFATNRGTGGNFGTIGGAPALASTNP